MHTQQLEHYCLYATLILQETVLIVIKVICRFFLLGAPKNIWDNYVRYNSEDNTNTKRIQRAACEVHKESFSLVMINNRRATHGFKITSDTYYMFIKDTIVHAQ